MSASRLGRYTSLESAPGSWLEPTACMAYLEMREISLTYREFKSPASRSLITVPTELTWANLKVQ